MLIFSFVVWFFIDALFFASSDAPFLRARQMGAFLSGILIANNRERSEGIISKGSFFALNLALGLVFMAITNLSKVKELPVIIGNFLSIGTVVPLAYAIISISLFWKKICVNSAIYYAGVISYELFLVHSYSLRLATGGIWLLLCFVVLTIGLSGILNKAFRKLRAILIN